MQQLLTLTRPAGLLAIVVLLSALLAACGSGEEPLRVYVTPTAATTEAEAAAQTDEMIVVSNEAAEALAGVGAQATATPGTFGPIITAPPSDGSPTAVTVTAATVTATATPRPSTTPPPTATTGATATTPPTATVEPSPTVQGTPLPTYNADEMGIQINANLSEQDFATMLWLAQRLGVKWIKFQMDWAEIEPERGVLSDLFYRYRIFVQDANAAGFNVMVSIAKAPAWARATAEEDGPPSNPQDLANFITTLMNEVRFDIFGRSYFDAIEVWNEPNLRREWHGADLNGAAYMQLFDAAYNAIRAAEGGSSTVVVTAGLAPTGINDGVQAIDDREFLRQMYAAGLADARYQNIAIGVHPYGAANPPDARCCGSSERGYDTDPTWFFLDTLEDYHAIMTAAGDSRQLWATEFGWGTYEGFVDEEGNPVAPPADPPYFAWITQEQQANYTLRAFEIGQSLPYVGVMVLWNLNFSGNTQILAGNEQAAYALLLPNVTDPLRPAFKLLEAAPKTSSEPQQ